MNLQYTELIRFTRDVIAPGNDMKKMMSIGLGIALARAVSLPIIAAEEANAHYANMMSFEICARASNFNENVVVDIDLVEQTARAFWISRVYHAYPPKLIALYSEEDGHFMNKIGGCGHLIAPDTFAFCEQNATKMVALVNRIREIVG